MNKSAQLLKKALSQTDERSKLEGEVIGGIDVVKCCAWEVRYLLRRTEPHATDTFRISHNRIATVIAVRCHSSHRTHIGRNQRL